MLYLDLGLSKTMKKLISVAYAIRYLLGKSELTATTMEARRQKDDMFKMLKDKDNQPRFLNPIKLSLKNERLQGSPSIMTI